MFSGLDVIGMFGELASAATGLIDLMGVLGLFFGVVMLFSAGKLLANGDPRTQEHKLGPVATRLLVGALLVQFGRTVSMLMEMTAGVGSGVRASMLDAIPATAGGGLWGIVVNAILLWVAAIGAFAICRGLFLWNKAGSGDSSSGGGDPAWAAFWHLLAGAICMNMGISFS
jgi:hypothetical protein